eukprot:7376776-Prymnesium_polylepis.1
MVDATPMGPPGGVSCETMTVLKLYSENDGPGTNRLLSAVKPFCSTDTDHVPTLPAAGVGHCRRFVLRVRILVVTTSALELCRVNRQAPPSNPGNVKPSPYTLSVTDSVAGAPVMAIELTSALYVVNVEVDVESRVESGKAGLRQDAHVELYTTPVEPSNVPAPASVNLQRAAPY